MSISLQDLLTKIPVDTKDCVDKIRKRINTILREAIRKEIGLVLNRQDVEPNNGNSSEMVSVPISLVPGFPEVLKEFKFEDDFGLVAVLSRYRTDLQHMKDSSEGISKLINELLESQKGRDVLADREGMVKPVYQLVKNLLQILDRGSELV